MQQLPIQTKIASAIEKTEASVATIYSNPTNKSEMMLWLSEKLSKNWD